MVKFDYDKTHRKGRLICDDAILTFVRNNFSQKNKNASFVNKKLRMQGNTRKVPDREYAIQASGLFDFGLYNDIRSFFISQQITEIEYSDSFKEVLKSGFCDTEVSDTLNHSLRDYQMETIEKCLRFGRGTIIVGTGGGKSLIQSSLIENWRIRNPNAKCLVIVPGLSLVTQLIQDFKSYGVSFTYSGWSGGDELMDTDVIVTNTENLCSKFGDYKHLANVDIVLTDECHRIKKSNVISKILQKIKTPNKFGFTGTLPKEKVDEWKIIGTFGPVIYYKNSKSLRDDNYLTSVEIKIIKLIHPKKKMTYQQEVEFLQNMEERNLIIKKISSKLNNNVLIMVNRLEHGQKLLDILQIENKETYFVSGEMDVESRKNIINLMEKQNNIICIAMSSIFSTGINIKNLHYIVFTFGEKSFIRTVQSIGRGLRLHDSKDKLILFDIYDNMKYSMDHVETRKQFYNEEQIPWKEIEIKL